VGFISTLSSRAKRADAVLLDGLGIEVVPLICGSEGTRSVGQRNLPLATSRRDRRRYNAPAAQNDDVENKGTKHRNVL
jgi:hypothetical protein